jgi:hypothetical protein
MSAQGTTLKEKHRHRKAVQAVQAYVGRLLVQLPSSCTDSNDDDVATGTTTTATTTATSTTAVSSCITPLVITHALALCHERFVCAVARQIVATKTESSSSSSSSAKVQRISAATVKEALDSLDLSHLVTAVATKSEDNPDASAAAASSTTNGTAPKKRAQQRQSIPCANTKKQRRNRQYSVLDEAEQERLLNLSREKLIGTTTLPKL